MERGRRHALEVGEELDEDPGAIDVGRDRRRRELRRRERAFVALDHRQLPRRQGVGILEVDLERREPCFGPAARAGRETRREVARGLLGQTSHLLVPPLFDPETGRSIDVDLALRCGGREISGHRLERGDQFLGVGACRRAADAVGDHQDWIGVDRRDLPPGPGDLAPLLARDLARGIGRQPEVAANQPLLEVPARPVGESGEVGELGVENETELLLVVAQDAHDPAPPCGRFEMEQIDVGEREPGRRPMEGGGRPVQAGDPVVRQPPGPPGAGHRDAAETGPPHRRLEQLVRQVTKGRRGVAPDDAHSVLAQALREWADELAMPNSKRGRKAAGAAGGALDGESDLAGDILRLGPRSRQKLAVEHQPSASDEGDHGPGVRIVPDLHRHRKQVGLPHVRRASHAPHFGATARRRPGRAVEPQAAVLVLPARAAGAAIVALDAHVRRLPLSGGSSSDSAAGRSSRGTSASGEPRFVERDSGQPLRAGSSRRPRRHAARAARMAAR